MPSKGFCHPDLNKYYMQLPFTGVFKRVRHAKKTVIADMLLPPV